MFTARYGLDVFCTIQVRLSLQKVNWDFYESPLLDSNLFFCDLASRDGTGYDDACSPGFISDVTNGGARARLRWCSFPWPGRHLAQCKGPLAHADYAAARSSDTISNSYNK